MFNKILIANRGEIALRIIRACNELSIKTVAIYSSADQYSLHVKFADEAICIGPYTSTESYLNISRIISAAELTNCDAIHPGYGFLSENPQFAQICKDNNFIFIGPSGDTIESMGKKANAKSSMLRAGVPVIPGSKGIINNLKELKNTANEIGYPIILKASSGGGGRGMRVVHNEKDLESAFKTASSESQIAFNDPDMYLEKFVENPRHIEIQILADNYGNVVHFGERECSIQRRHQKLIEESPSPVINNDIREKMGLSAIKGAKSINYSGLGTMEFLFDEKLNEFYFMEMNTRIQVEHPVTEMVIGKDLVKLQIRIAFGEKISDNLNKLVPRGHSIECRINAEDPLKNFMPSPGIIREFHSPGGMGVRVDSHVYSGYSIPPYYDSMIAKLIVHGENRNEAINRMNQALGEFIIEGPKTTIDFQKAILKSENFKKGIFHTGFLDDFKYP